MSDPVVQEVLLRSFYSIVLDGQHGMQGFSELREGCARAAFLGKPAIVRVAPGDLASAGRMADLGAAGIILPMVESAEEASRFAKSLRYMPEGTRSFGPTRAADLLGYGSGRAYLDEAGRSVVSFAMIETASALAELDAILAVPELDGIFVGPSDLSLAIGDGVLDPNGEGTDRQIGEIVRKAREAGKAAAIYALSAADAHRYAAMGCQLIGVASDLGILKEGCRRVVNEFRGAR
ncbi:aldolase/citrate lyase family protein [Aureimonas sp. ME7]|uniref:HpcH/HpaI aldolase family protein n=1 Tax=Aureimonas sp. ME7 TaxID=2744252 RepID=UPI0015F37109|nr:aldolase/citrate lyase family protein [Aureimonas sp. ME7]